MNTARARASSPYFLLDSKSQFLSIPGLHLPSTACYCCFESDHSITKLSDRFLRSRGSRCRLLILLKVTPLEVLSPFMLSAIDWPYREQCSTSLYIVSNRYSCSSSRYCVHSSPSFLGNYPLDIPLQCFHSCPRASSVVEGV